MRTTERRRQRPNTSPSGQHLWAQVAPSVPFGLVHPGPGDARSSAESSSEARLRSSPSATRPENKARERARRTQPGPPHKYDYRSGTHHARSRTVWRVSRFERRPTPFASRSACCRRNFFWGGRAPSASPTRGPPSRTETRRPRSSHLSQLESLRRPGAPVCPGAAGGRDARVPPRDGASGPYELQAAVALIDGAN